jgi:MoaA/NifB/PqqE/SkfB family radical SAM enzyme
MKPYITKPEIIKAEILWTRMCPLKCSYCAMADGRRNTVPLDLWKEGFIQLQKLGCSFAAFYGAEPLYDFDKLPEVIQFAEDLGIHTTVITSGVVSDVNNKLKTLYEHGLRSITTSYDAVSLDTSSKTKTNKALEIIDTFRSFGPYRDSAVVMTLTKTNYRELPRVIKEMSEKNIWTFFDLIHPDRLQRGSKVKNYDANLFFDKKDWPGLIDVLKESMELKEKGYLCHTSHTFVEILKIIAGIMSAFDANGFDKYDSSFPYLLWNCANYDLDCFPSWVTVDADGTVYPCDDFQPKTITLIKIWEIYNLWDNFCKEWKPIVRKECPGCLWNTHIDAHSIKQGILPIADYIHGLEKKAFPYSKYGE